MRGSRLVAACAMAWLGVASSVCAQTYPARPITLLVPFPAGGPTDVLARILSNAMSATLKQQIIVEDVGGASGTVGAARASRAAPDGYTLFLHNVSHATAPSLYKSLPYDPVADFEPIGLVAEVPQALVGAKKLPPNTLPELIAYLRSSGGKVTMANAGRGSGSHLCALVFMNATGTKLTEIPYRGTGPAINDLVGGQVELMCDQVSNTGSQIKAETIKGYCVAAKAQVASLPGVPSCAEAGLAGFLASVWHGLYAPKGTPPAVLKAVEDALQSALQDASVRMRLAELGAEPEPPARVTPEALREQLKAEIGKWSAIIKAADLKPE